MRRPGSRYGRDAMASTPSQRPTRHFGHTDVASCCGVSSHSRLTDLTGWAWRIAVLVLATPLLRTGGSGSAAARGLDADGAAQWSPQRIPSRAVLRAAAAEGLLDAILVLTTPSEPARWWRTSRNRGERSDVKPPNRDEHHYHELATPLPLVAANADAARSRPHAADRRDGARHRSGLGVRRRVDRRPRHPRPLRRVRVHDPRRLVGAHRLCTRRRPGGPRLAGAAAPHQRRDPRPRRRHRVRCLVARRRVRAVARRPHRRPRRAGRGRRGARRRLARRARDPGRRLPPRRPLVGCCGRGGRRARADARRCRHPAPRLAGGVHHPGTDRADGRGRDGADAPPPDHRSRRAWSPTPWRDDRRHRACAHVRRPRRRPLPRRAPPRRGVGTCADRRRRWW